MSFSKVISRFIPFILTGAIALQVTGCSGDSSAQNGAEGGTQFRQDTALVSVATVHERNFERSLRATGTLMPKQQATLNVLLNGMIAEIYVDISDKVQKGDPLLKIRQVDYREALEQAEANVASARAALEDAKRELDRTRNLREAGSGTVQMLDQATTRYSQAQASLKQAEAAYSVAKQNMADTIVRAPFDGVITERNFEPNEYARAGDAVFEIMDLSVLDANLQIPEAYLGAISRDAEVEISFKAQFPSKVGEIIAINPKVNTATRTFTVKIQTDNRDLMLPGGLFIIANINLPEAQNVPAVPKEAIQKREGRTFVWLIKDGNAFEQEVVEGASNQNWVMIEQGLNPGDRIAVEGTGVLIDGYPVKISGSFSNHLGVSLAR